jgi:ankyrin repeat protein/beta-lactamase regulating signal transducer with metallopeptidase domain
MDLLLTQITDYLLAQSWQIAVLTIAVAVTSFLLRNRSAHVRYLLWLIVLAKCLVPPLYMIPVAVLPQGELPAYAPEPPVAESMISENSVPEAALTEFVGPTSVQSEIASSPRVTQRPAGYDTRAWLAMGWLAGVVSLSLYYLLNALRTQIWLQMRRKALPSDYRGNIESLFIAHGVRHMPRVWLLDRISQPFVWGLVRGSIYLPAELFADRHAKFHVNLLGHELSHVVRLDAMINTLQVVAQTVFWFHPFVWWANGKIRAEREKCCDEMTIARLNALPEEYSEAIVEVLAAKYGQGRPVPSLAVAGQVKNIEERIKTMMRPGKKFYKRPSLIAAIIVLVLAMITVPTALVLTARAKTEAATEHAEKRYASLYEAAKAGDLAEVKRLIAKAADLNAFDKEDGLTPLGVAANRGHTEIVKILLDSGAKVDIAASGGYSPIRYAVLNYDKETIRALISGGADVNIAPDNSDTPLLTAIWGDQTDIVKALLDAGANAELKDDNGMSSLQHALDIGMPDIVKLLANTDDRVPDLHRAALKGDLSKLKELLGAGADINDKDAFGRTPIEYALAGGQIDVAKFLLDQGVDINLKLRRNRSLLHLAARAGLLEIVQILIEKGIPVDTVSQGGGTILNEAVSYGHKEIAEFLISKGAALDSKGQANQSTPLHVAASIGDTDIVELLITNGADINASNWSGSTPLDVARQTSHTKIVDVLRQHGAKETLYGAFILGDTIGDTNELKSLISQGPDINIKWPNGVTLLHVAAQKGYKDIAKLLIDKGADVNAQSGNLTPLHLGVENGNKDVVELLIANGADVNAKRNTRSRNASTALHDAVDASRGDIVELLIAHGADVKTLSHP